VPRRHLQTPERVTAEQIIRSHCPSRQMLADSLIRLSLGQYQPLVEGTATVRLVRFDAVALHADLVYCGQANNLKEN
jgi:hypothetical protein